MDDPGQRSAPGEDGRTWEEERTLRLRRNKVVGYVVTVLLWLLSAVPLARLASDEGGGAGVAAVFLAVGLGIAILLRAIYARQRGRAFWSPWLFVIAAVLAIASYGIQSAGEKAASATASERSSARRATTPGSPAVVELSMRGSHLPNLWEDEGGTSQ